MSSGRNGTLRFSAVSPEFEVIKRFLEVSVINFFVELDENPLNIGKISFLIQNIIICGAHFESGKINVVVCCVSQDA